MKKILRDYYAFIVLIPFFIWNLFLDNLILDGFLFPVFIIIHIILLILFRKNIKRKSILVIIYFLTIFLVKNKLQLFFCISSLLTLIITGFMESNKIKIFSVFLTIFFAFFAMPILFITVFIYGIQSNEERGDIYEDTYYYCENNYEIYAFSAGAMDKFHYSIGKNYKILDLGDVIYISYQTRNEVTEEEYTHFLNNHSCKLVEDKNVGK